MAKINKTDIYPIKENINFQDYLIGTDSKSQELETVSFEIQGIVDFIKKEIINDSYNTFLFLDNVPNNLNVSKEYNYKLLKTIDGLYYFTSNEDLSNSKLYVKKLDKFFELNEQNKHPIKNAWKLEITSEDFINNELYFFSLRFNEHSSTSYIEIEGNGFSLSKNPLNINTYVEINDLAINGWRNENAFETALLYKGGNPAFFSSWESVGQIIELNS